MTRATNADARADSRDETSDRESGFAPAMHAGFEFLPDDSEMVQLVRAIDWSTTPLGSPETWTQALKTSLGIVFNSRQPMVLMWGPELIQFYNDAFRPSLGVGKHPRAMGQRAAECWPESWHIIGLQIEDVMQRGIPSWHENQLVPIFRNGAIEDVYWTYGYSPVFEADGSIAANLVICLETTHAVVTRRELQQAHDAAADARSHLIELVEENRALTEAIPQQVWTSRPDGTLDFVSQRVLEYFSASREEILGAGWQNVIHSDDIAACISRWLHSLATGDEYEVEFRLRRADGAYRWHLARALPVRDTSGKIVRWFGTNTDIDEQKRIREELKRRTEFEQHLVGIVSHDLRNPLHAIVLGTRVLAAHDNLDARASKVVLRMQSSAQRGARMISDLLDFTQARSHEGIPIKRSSVNVHVVVAQVVEEVRAAHPDRTLEVSHAGDGTGNWDADRVAQLLVNLVSNAVHYGAPDKPVTITTRSDPAQLTLEVHNHGEPIPRELVNELFTPMKRGASSANETGRSIGLGLFIVKAIVEGHGGSVEVSSTHEHGTTFSVRLPRGV